METRLDSVNLIITELCDSKCLSCSYWRSEGHHLPIEVLERDILPWLQEVQPKAVRLTGGEPTIHPDFIAIAQTIRKCIDGYMVLNTHGGGLLQFLPQIKHIFDAYIISCDSATRLGYSRIRGVDWFCRVARLPHEIHLISAKIHVAYSVVIQPRNVRELSDIIRLAFHAGADMVTLNLPTLIEGAYQNKNQRLKKQERLFDFSCGDIEELKKQLKEISCIRKDLPCSFILQSDSTLDKYIEVIEQRAESSNKSLPVARCGVPFSSLTISQNGHVKPCFILPHGNLPAPLTKYPDSRWIEDFQNNFLRDDTIVEKWCKRCYVYPYVLSEQDI